MPDIDHKDHVSRLIKPKYVYEDGEISSAAFELRKEMDETFLSVNHVEYFSGASNEKEALQLMREDIKPYSLSNNYQLAILNVNATITHVKDNTSDNRILEFCKIPSQKNNFSHAGIFELKHDDIAVQELIAESVVRQYKVSEL